MGNNAVFSQRERNIIILLIVIALGGILLYALKGIFGAILGTFVMYTLFRNLNRFFIEQWRWPKSLSAVVIIILSIFIIVLPFVGIGTMLINKAIALQQNPEWITKLVDTVNTFVGDKFGKPDFLKEQVEASASY